MLRPTCRAPATLTFQGSPTSAPSPRSRAPLQGEARSSSRFSCTRGPARRPGWGEGHWDQLPPVPVHACCSRHQGPLSSSRPCRCSRARALVPGRGRTHSPRRRVVGRPCPEGAKRLGGAGRVSAPRFFLALVPAGPNPGPPQAPGHARRSRLGRVFLARHSSRQQPRRRRKKGQCSVAATRTFPVVFGA